MSSKVVNSSSNIDNVLNVMAMKLSQRIDSKLPDNIDRRKQISVRGIAQVETVSEIKSGFNRHLHYTLIKDRNIATTRDYYFALAHCVRDHMVSRWIRTQQSYYERDPKRVYYLSMEYNMGRSLQNTMINVGIDDACDEAMYQLGLDIEELEEMEGDVDLGSIGFGRLSACFLDSMATLGIPSYAYGIRYNCGAFSQKIKGGEQLEEIDDWLRYGNPWEKSRPEFVFPIHFYGRVADTPNGRQWVDTQVLYALPYDYPIPGYQNNVINTLRLWCAKAPQEFNLEFFNGGDYIQAILDRCLAENITRLLYPNNEDASENREVRLKQEYFLCAASLGDIIRRFKSSKSAARKHSGRTDFTRFAEKNAIQLNDTPSALIIPELMRILVDIEKLPWDEAWRITRATCSVTIHSILPETLEKWPITMIEKLLPRHMEIIYQINLEHLERAKAAYAPDLEKAYNLTCIRGGGARLIDMAYLSIIGSHAVNGVSKMHSNTLQVSEFKDLYEFESEKFQNKTNGITPRRWLFLCNPILSNVISERIGEKWTIQLEKLEALKKWSKHHGFQMAVAKAKHDNKMKLAEIVEEIYGITINPASLYDVQMQHFHGYKRQLLNCLHIVTLYNQIKCDPNLRMTPRTVVIGGKAEPGYYVGKQIIKLICSIANYVNNDPIVSDKLIVIFMQNYGVTLAEQIVPCADLSQQLSLAGTHAAGTSCMKFALNGALTIGSRDGITAELAEEIGSENMFTFGMTADEANALKAKGNHNPMEYYNKNANLKLCLDQIRNGYFSPLNPNEFRAFVDDLLKNDKYFVLADYEDYMRAQKLASGTFADKKTWNEMAIRNIASCGKFSVDRTVIEYARDIWNVEPTYDVLPAPADP